MVATHVASHAENGHASMQVGTPLTAVEMSGYIKWFDSSRGFGFIVPDGDKPDILLHGTCLRRSGFKAAPEGARVVCEAVQGAKGLQCLRILSMDESSAVRPRTSPKTHDQPDPATVGGFERAEVRRFERNRGFGFLTVGEDKPDIFVHMEHLRAADIVELRPGQTVMVRYGRGTKGLLAAEIRPDGWFPQAH